MLAPLKDRNLIERESSTGSAETPDLQAENLALRQARRSQRRSATLTARQIVTLNNEISRLQQLNLSLQQQCEDAGGNPEAQGTGSLPARG